MSNIIISEYAYQRDQRILSLQLGKLEQKLLSLSSLNSHGYTHLTCEIRVQKHMVYINNCPSEWKNRTSQRITAKDNILI
jgi:hypothetical protein